MDRNQKKLLNQIRHVRNEAERLFKRVDDMCPPEFANHNDITRDNDLGFLWCDAFNAAFRSFDALDELVRELAPASLDSDDK